MEYIKFPHFQKRLNNKYLAQIFGLYIFRKLKHLITELHRGGDT